MTFLQQVVLKQKQSLNGRVVVDQNNLVKKSTVVRLAVGPNLEQQHTNTASRHPQLKPRCGTFAAHWRPMLGTSSHGLGG